MVKYICVWILGILLPALLPGLGYGRPIEMPITIDYPFLRSLVISAAFTGPQNTALLVDRAEGCRRVVVSEPQFFPEGDFVRLETKVDIRLGALLGKKCRFKIHWDGYVSLVLNPRIDPALWRLGFSVVDSQVYDSQHKPAWIVGLIWKMIRGKVFDYLSAITVDLGPPVQELKALLPEVLPTHTSETVKRFVDGLHPGRIRVESDAIRIPLLSELEEVPTNEAAVPEVLDEAALGRLTRQWEDWDIFLVYLLTSLRSAPLSAEDRAILFTALLEARYGFVRELDSGSLTDQFVQEQFLTAWTAVAPVFRSQRERETTTGKLLGYLSFFTATDALKSLQAIGPSLGLEISRNGLIRLAGLMADERTFTWAYGAEVDADLRKTFDLGSAPEIPAEPAEDAPSPEGLNVTRFERLLKRLLSGLVPICWAAGEPSEASLDKWLVSRDNVDAYIPAVQQILADAAQKALQRSDAEEQQAFFRAAVMATAWQESCWRQFHVQNGQLTYLRSYNGTSVGLMQINERVWRGLYQLDALRWNIHYNVAAGCDIMNLYHTRYILKKQAMFLRDGQPDPELVPRVLYAMYNGGPGELRKFLARHGQGNYYTSDDLFWEKYQWVEAHDWDKVKICLFGEE
ncbi:MAG: lytic transglycosylase domain-containing protein [Deltaproteobacteria bacterium]|nr:lytic transglycosylase domain-containing protein [Deltaproteobacteria bacterium]